MSEIYHPQVSPVEKEAIECIDLFQEIIRRFQNEDDQSVIDMLVKDGFADSFLEQNDRQLNVFFDSLKEDFVTPIANDLRVPLLAKNLRDNFFAMKKEVFRLRKRIARNKIAMKRLTDKLTTPLGRSQQRSKWQADFKSLANSCKKDSIFNYNDPEAMKKHTETLAKLAIDRGIQKASRSHESYSSKSVCKLVVNPLPGVDDKFAIEFEDSQRGESESIISIIAKVYDMPDLVRELKGFDFSINLDNKHDFECWKMLASVFIKNKLLPIRNNGSKGLIKFRNDDGSLSDLCKFLDSLAENISSSAVYLLGLINGSNENILGVKDSISEPLNGADREGREILAVAYDSNRTGLLNNPDGSGATNFTAHENIGQTRFWLVNGIEQGKIKEDAKGLFAKGQQFIGKFTAIRDCNGELKIFTVNDLINLAALADQEIIDLGYSESELTTLRRECSEFYSVDSEFALNNVDYTLYRKVLLNKHFYIPVGCTYSEILESRLHAWEELFKRDKSLPYVVGLELGQIKCRAKNEFAAVAKTKLNNVKEALKASAHGVVELDGDLYGCVIIKSPSDKISSTSMCFQQTSLLASKFCRGINLEQIWAEYCIETDAMLGSFESKSFSEDKKLRFDRFIKHLKLEGTRCEKNGKVLTKNFKSSLWRWFTNFNKTTQPTRRILMHEISYRGFCIMDDCFNHTVCKVAQQRGPLISPFALQANVYISRRIACNLLQKIRLGEVDDSIEVIRKRISFRNSIKIEDVTQDMIVNLLKEVLAVTTTVVVTDAIVLMHPADVEAMQGDDDGDTVSVDKHSETVAVFEYTEIFWKDFFLKNGIQTIELEVDKKVQVDFKVGTRILLDFVRKKNPEPPTEEEREAISQYGIEAPAIAKYFGLPGTKIPNLLGLTYAELHELDNATNGLFMTPENLAMIACKFASNPAGPIGAPSNCAPDLMIKALSLVDANGLLSEIGKFVFEGYKNSASQVQISIDFQKRIVEILNSFLMWVNKYPDFSKQLVKEDIADFLVKNTSPVVNLVHIESTPYNVDKTVRVFVNDKAEPIESYGQWLWNCNPLEVYLVTSKDLHALSSVKIKDVRVDVKEINLRDKDNYCFDFDSIYAFAGFVINAAYPGVKPSVWKTSLDEILGKRFDDVKYSFSVSSQNSLLVENATNFLKYYESSDLMKELLRVTPDFIAFAKESEIGSHLDPLYPAVNVAIAKFFDEEYSFTKKVSSPRKVLKALFAAYGLDESQAGLLKRGETISYRDIDTNIFDIIVSMARHDQSYSNQDVPQTAWQMLLEEYLDPEEDSDLFKFIVPCGTANAIKDITLLNTFPKDGKYPRSIASPPKRVIEYFGKEFEAELLKRDLIIRRPNAINYVWKSPQAIYTAAHMAMQRFKELNLFSFQEYIKSGEPFSMAVKEIEADPFLGAQEIQRVVKAAYRKYDDIIKYLSVLKIMKYVPICPFGDSGFSKEKKPRYQYMQGSFSEPQKNAVFCGMSMYGIGHGVNLYATMLDPINVFRTLSNDEFTRDPQVNRLSQWDSIYYFASQGHYTKSFSYFGNSGWKDPRTVRLIEEFQNNTKTLTKDLRIVPAGGMGAEIPMREHIRRMTFLKIIGLNHNSASKVLCGQESYTKKFNYDQNLLSNVLVNKSVGIVTRTVWRPLNSRGICDDSIPTVWDYSLYAWLIYSVTLRYESEKDMRLLKEHLEDAGIHVDYAYPKTIGLFGKKFKTTKSIIKYFSTQLAFNK